MAKGIALTIGLNAVNPVNYAGWSGHLNVCEADANDLAHLLEAQGFECQTLLTEQATRGRVIAAIRHAARTLRCGDVLLVSYSGHGGRLPDLNRVKPDDQDGTWCLYDGELVDDELFTLWGDFAAGVRVVQLSDSCHSGSMIRQFGLDAPGAAPGALARAMPADVARRVYADNRNAYDPILKQRDRSRSKEAVNASVLLISACRDDQLSYEGTFNGVFTSAVKQIWNGGQFHGTYKQFHKAIRASIDNGQEPQLTTVGMADLGLSAGTPFSI